MRKSLHAIAACLGSAAFLPLAHASDIYRCALRELGQGGASAQGDYDLNGTSQALRLSAGPVTAVMNYTRKHKDRRGLLGVMRSDAVLGAHASFMTYEPVQEIQAGFSPSDSENYKLECIRL